MEEPASQERRIPTAYIVGICSSALCRFSCAMYVSIQSEERPDWFTMQKLS